MFYVSNVGRISLNLALFYATTLLSLLTYSVDKQENCAVVSTCRPTSLSFPNHELWPFEFRVVSELKQLTPNCPRIDNSYTTLQG